MSPKRRFLTAMLGGKPDRVPVGNAVSIATVDLMKIADAHFPEVHLDPSPMARLAAAGHTVLGYDTIMPVFSVTQEAAALGAEVNWGGPKMMPAVRNHPFAEAGRPGLPDGWMETAPIRVVLEALRILREQWGDKVVIVGKAMGPWSLSYHMMGAEDFLVSTIEDPGKAQRSLEVLKEVTIAFARAQMQAGADVICIADHATGGMVSPLMYRDMLLPVHREIVERVQCPTILHCCGNTTDRVQFFAEAGFDCYHFESQVDIRRAVSDAAGKMTLMGNVNNPEILLDGTVDQVKQACRSPLDHGIQILAPECAVPLFTPTENLRALVDCVQASE